MNFRTDFNKRPSSVQGTQKLEMGNHRHESYLQKRARFMRNRKEGGLTRSEVCS